MTDQRDKAVVPPDESVDTSAGGAAPESPGRRALLRGAAIAAPTILTLGSSSAAMAMASVKTYTTYTGAQPDGNFYCLEQNSTLGPPGADSSVLQIGDAPTPNVYRIEPRDYRASPDEAGVPVDGVQMCRESDPAGTNYYYAGPDGLFSPDVGVNVKRGILMSAGAYTSLGVGWLPVDEL